MKPNLPSLKAMKEKMISGLIHQVTTHTKNARICWNYIPPDKIQPSWNSVEQNLSREATTFEGSELFQSCAKTRISSSLVTTSFPNKASNFLFDLTVNTPPSSNFQT